MAAVLEGIKVVDLSQVAAGPMCARHLADFGADVLHIENPQTGDYFRYFLASMQDMQSAAPSEFDYLWENYNRNKRSVTIDIAQGNGQEVIHRLIEQADVLVTNLRPLELERYRMDYATLSRLNPRLVWGCISGYGRQGPEKDTPSYDASALHARSGLMNIMSPPGLSGPTFRPALGDNVAALAMAFGIMLALYQREKTGRGQEVDAALMHTGLYMLTFDIGGALTTGLDYSDWRAEPPADLVARAQEGTAPVQSFYANKSRNPLVGAYASSDGRAILLVALQSDRYWEKTCRIVGREDLATDPRYATADGRAENCPELREALSLAFLTKTLAEWQPLLSGVPCAPLQSIKEAVNDPQARANDFFVTIDHPSEGSIDVIASPVKLGESPASYRMPAPEFGQHTEEVLLEHGYGWDDIIRFKEQGIIA